MVGMRRTENRHVGVILAIKEIRKWFEENAKV
jgi:hypothetical protein